MPTTDVRRIGTTQVISLTTDSVAVTNAFGTQSYLVRLTSNVATNFKIGDGVQTAARTDPYLAQNWTDYITVTPGQRISALAFSTVTPTGSLWVTELSG